MKDETRSVKTLQKALLSHAKASRWILASLDNAGATPKIMSLRISRHETVVVLEESGVIHSPDYKTLHSYAGKKRKVWTSGQVNVPKNLILEKERRTFFPGDNRLKGVEPKSGDRVLTRSEAPKV